MNKIGFFRGLIAALCLAIFGGAMVALAAPPAPLAAQTVPAGVTGGGLGTGSTLDTLSTTLPDPDIETNKRSHVVTTARLPEEDDFEFFRRHANRVARFAKFLRGEK